MSVIADVRSNWRFFTYRTRPNLNI